MRTGEKFEALFSRATGHEPYPYQSRIGAASLLPDAIDVPTGCGKTAAIVIAWLWRLLEAPNDIRRATPRRLVLALPFRSLADQTELAVRGWIERLDVDVDVHVVMGGRMQESRSWRESPERISILIGTIDRSPPSSAPVRLSAPPG